MGRNHSNISRRSSSSRGTSSRSHNLKGCDIINEFSLSRSRSRHWCWRCDKSFSRPSDLQRHLVTFHNEPRFNCIVPNCARRTKAFSRKDKLVEHLRSCHNIAIKTATIPRNPTGVNDGPRVDVFLQARGNWLVEPVGTSSPFVLPHAASSANKQYSLNLDRHECEINASGESMSTEWLHQVEGGGYVEDFNQNKHNQSSQNASDPSAAICPRFACPYFKRDRQTYQSSPCIGPGWVSLHRLKEHLYRRHGQFIKCQRCSRAFDDKEKFLVHLDSSRDCSSNDEMVTLGFTEEQKWQLKCRQRASKEQTQKDKWYAIYQILFPDDDPRQYPSPYYDDEPGECHEQLQLPGRELLHQYDKFLSRELPKSVLEKVGLELLLDDKLDPDGVTVLEESINDCQKQLSRKFMATVSSESSKEFAGYDGEGSLPAELQSGSTLCYCNLTEFHR